MSEGQALVEETLDAAPPAGFFTRLFAPRSIVVGLLSFLVGSATGLVIDGRVLGRSTPTVRETKPAAHAAPTAKPRPAR